MKYLKYQKNVKGKSKKVKNQRSSNFKKFQIPFYGFFKNTQFNFVIIKKINLI